MKKVPFWFAVFVEIALILCHDFYESPDIWYVIGINGIFIIVKIIQIIYEYYQDHHYKL